MPSLTENPTRSLSALERAINALMHSEDQQDHEAARWLQKLYWRFDDEAREQRLTGKIVELHPIAARVRAINPDVWGNSTPAA